MIGGIEYHLPTQEQEPLKESVRAIKTYWPDAVCEYVTDAEIFVYRDLEAKEMWSRDVPEEKNIMIHLLTTPGVVTVVLDKPDRTLVLPIHLYLNK